MGDSDLLSSGGQKDVLVSVNDQTFEQMIEMSDRPAFVMFQSTTCPHCRTISPYIQEYPGEFFDRILFATLEDLLLHGSECAANSTEIDYEISDMPESLRGDKDR